MFSQIHSMKIQDIPIFCRSLIRKHSTSHHSSFKSPVIFKSHTLQNLKKFQISNVKKNNKLFSVSEFYQEPAKTSRVSKVSFLPTKKDINVNQQKYLKLKKTNDIVGLAESTERNLKSQRKNIVESMVNTTTTRNYSQQQMQEQIQHLKNQLNHILKLIETTRQKDNNQKEMTFIKAHYNYTIQQIQFLRQKYFEHYSQNCKQPYSKQQCLFLRRRFMDHYDYIHNPESMRP